MIITGEAQDGYYKYELPEFKFALNDGLTSDFLPMRANDTDTGWDVKASKDYIIHKNHYVKIELGFRVFAPQGWWLELRPRSSTFAKKQLHALYGVIDEGYEGQCLFACQYIEDWTVAQPNQIVIKKGDAIGQLIPVRRKKMIVTAVTNEEFDKLCQERNLARGAGGFGSTDEKKGK
jgi:dUTPase